MVVKKTFQVGIRTVDAHGKKILLRRRFPDDPEGREAGKRWQLEQQRERYNQRAGLSKLVESVTVEQALREQLQDRESTGTSYVLTEKHYANVVLLAFPALSQKLLHETTVEDWEMILGPKGYLVTELNYAPSTHNAARAFYHRLYVVNMRKRVPRAHHNPISHIQRIKHGRPEIEFLETKESVAAYIAACYQDERYPSLGIFAMIALNTGLRVGNVVALQWMDVDFANRRLWIRRKYDYHQRGTKPGTKAGDETKTLGINEPLFHALQAWRAKCGDVKKTDFVVFKNSPAVNMTQDDVRNRHVRALKRAKLDPIKVHALRHTFAVHFLENGGNLHELKEQLFHSSITITERYIHVVKHRLHNRAAVVSFAVPTPSENVHALFSRKDKKDGSSGM